MFPLNSVNSVSKINCHYSKRFWTCHLKWNRPGCSHSANKTHVRDRDFKLTPIHALVIYQIPWIHWIPVSFTENSIDVSQLTCLSKENHCFKVYNVVSISYSCDSSLTNKFIHVNTSADSTVRWRCDCERGTSFWFSAHMRECLLRFCLSRRHVFIWIQRALITIQISSTSWRHKKTRDLLVQNIATHQPTSTASLVFLCSVLWVVELPMKDVLESVAIC